MLENFTFLFLHCPYFQLFFVTLQTKRQNMEAIITWAKENYNLIVLAVGIAGIVIAVLSLILEMKKRKNQ